MKKIWLIGQPESLNAGLSKRMSIRGYSIQRVHNFKEVKRLLQSGSPDFILCTGRIQIDENGDYYLEV